MERSLTQEEWQEEMLMMDLERRGIIPSRTREAALQELERLRAKDKEKKK